MRDNYIQLVKDYITKTPQYKNTLDELKRNVLLAGATEKEFEEAIRQVEDPQQDTNQKQTAKHFFGKKTVIAIVSLIFLILIPAVLLLSTNSKLKLTTTVTNTSQIKESSSGPFPVVYANTTPIDVKKVFSIPSDNIKLTVSGKPKKEVLGFFPYWMLEEHEKINLWELSTIALFGLEVNAKGEIVTVGADGKEDQGWTMWQDKRLDALIKRARSQGLSIQLVIKSFSNENIQNLSLSDEAQKKLIANVTYLVNSKNLDGVNIDFESNQETTDEVRQGFTRLIKNLKTELMLQNPESQLTIDTYLVSGSQQGLFNLELLEPYTDAFVIMGYDMHTPSGDPGPVAAMGGDRNVIGYVQNYIEKISKDKLILAVPYYGYDWPTDKDSTAETKILPYAEINLATKNTQIYWNEDSQTPFYQYTEGGIQRIVHFDNVRSLGIKYDFIKKKDLRGVGIWALGYDGLNSDLEKLLVDKFINE